MDKATRDKVSRSRLNKGIVVFCKKHGIKKRLYVYSKRRHFICSKCSYERNKRDQLLNPDRWKKYNRTYKEKIKGTIEYKNRCRKWWLKSNYSLSTEDYNKLHKKQGGCCAICKRIAVEHLSVDHNHQTGKVRGLLCKKCNSGIGYFEDSIMRLCEAVNYLQKGE